MNFMKFLTVIVACAQFWGPPPHPLQIMQKNLFLVKHLKFSDNFRLFCTHSMCFRASHWFSMMFRSVDCVGRSKMFLEVVHDRFLRSALDHCPVAVASLSSLAFVFGICWYVVTFIFLQQCNVTGCHTTQRRIFPPSYITFGEVFFF